VTEPWKKDQQPVEDGPRKKYGAAAPPPPERGAGSRFVTGVYQTTVGPLVDIWEHQKKNVAEHGAFVGGAKTLWDIGTGLIRASNEEGVKTLKALGGMEFGEAIRHLPGIIPGVGPAAVGISEEAERGNLAGAAGQATGLIGTALVGAKAGQIRQGIRNIPARTGRVVDKTSSRMIESALKPGPEKYSPAERAAMVKTVKQEGLPISHAGQEKLYRLIENLNKEREAVVQAAPRPEAIITERPQPARLTAGAREMPPTTPPAGTAQAVVSEALPGARPVQFGKFSEVADLPERLRPVWESGDLRQGQVSTALEHAKNAQLIEVINKRARETGLLDAVQDAARAAGREVPLEFSDIYDVKLGNVIYPKDVARRIDQIKDRFRSVNPEADLAALESAKQEFLRSYPKPLSLQQAQKIKSTTYRVIGKRSYMEKTAKTQATTEGEKALAHGLMEELAEQIPEVAAINARESGALGLQPAMDTAISRVRNWEMFAPGLYGSVGGIGLGLATGSVSAGAAGAAMITVLRNPAVKSRLAIAMSAAAKRSGKLLTVNKASGIVDKYLARIAAGMGISLSGLPKSDRQSEPVR